MTDKDNTATTASAAADIAGETVEMQNTTVPLRLAVDVAPMKLQKDLNVSDVEEEKGQAPHAKLVTSGGSAVTLVNNYGDIEDLSDAECYALTHQLNIMSDETLQLKVFDELLSVYPTLDASFSYVSGRSQQATFLCGMIRKGYTAVCVRKYANLYNILLRHKSYGILKMHLTSSFEIILRHVLELENNPVNSLAKQVTARADEDAKDDTALAVLPAFGTNNSGTSVAWKKATDILTQMVAKVYKRGFSEKKQQRRQQRQQQQLDKNRRFIARSMRQEDIECVLRIWEEIIEHNKEAVGQVLAEKLENQREIYQVFQKFEMDIFKQSSVLINMLEKAIKQLNNLDELIPFMKKLGLRHCKMGIKPQWLAIMKRVFLELIKETLGFNLTTSVKQSWNAVMTFIVGIMLTGYAKNTGDMDESASASLNNPTLTNSASASTTQLTADFVLNKLASTLKGVDVNNIDSLTMALTPHVIADCQRSWKHISNDVIIHNAVRIFYNDLMDTKDEIKALFSRSNMREQSNRLVRAIGSTVELLDELDTLIPILQELGKRHVYYNVQPRHFKYVKVCWFKMLKHSLRLQWNKEIQTAWNIAWEFMTFYMKQSLEDALLLYVPPDPVMVNFKVLVNHLDRINVVDGSCFIDVWYGAYTGDNSSQSYAFNTGSGDGNVSIPDTTPHQAASLPFGGVRCLNGMHTADAYRQNADAYLRYFEEDETWYLRGNLVGEFAQQFAVNLRAYPFDTHLIDLTFSLRVDDSVALFNADRMNVRLMPFKRESMAGPNWTVYDARICAMEMSAIKGGSSSGRRYTQCKIAIPIARKYSHHLYHEFVPLLAMQLLGFAVYFVDLFPVAERMIFSVLVFLGLCAFYSQSMEQLPSLPYLTVFDWWCYTAGFLSLYHLIGLCVVHEYENELNDRNLRRLSLYIALGGAVLFVLFQIAFILRAVLLVRRYPTKTSEFKADNVALEAIARNVLKAPMATAYMQSIESD